MPQLRVHQEYPKLKLNTPPVQDLMSKVFRRRFTRRGVSVIIAALLLIAIAVAAAVLLYVFSIGLLGSLSSSGGQQTKQQVILEAYDWTAAALVIHLRNVGSATVNLLAADYFVNGGSSTAVAGTPPCTVTVIPGAASCTMSLAMPAGFTPTAGAAYPIKVVTPDGGVFSYSAIKGQAS